MGLPGLGVGFGQQVIALRMNQLLQECAGDLSLLQVVRPSRPISWSEGCLDRLKCLSINAILAWSVSWELRLDSAGMISSSRSRNGPASQATWLCPLSAHDIAFCSGLISGSEDQH